MNKSSSSFFSIVAILVFCFIISPTSTKHRVLKSFETLFNLEEGSLNNAYRSIKMNDTVSGTNSEKISHSDEAIKYYEEICLKTEDGRSYTNPMKWEKDVKIYVSGYRPDYMMSELDDIVSELNDLINPIDLEIVSSKSEANTFIFLGSDSDFKETYSFLKNKDLSRTAGYFTIKPENAYLYVNMDKLDGDVEAQKSVLREELTQSLGLCNDSWEYPNSIFYQGWSTNTEYSDLDKEIIQMLYNE